MKKPIIISYFHGGGIQNTTKQNHISIQRLYNGITTYEGWIKTTKNIRDIFKKYGKGSKYKQAKRQLDYFMPSGVWSSRKPDGKLIKPSYLLQIDIDNIEPSKMNQIKQKLIKDKHSLLIFKSPSGLGFKCFIKYSSNIIPPPVLVVLYYKNLNIDIDPATLHNKQACYLVHDSEAYINLNAVPLVIKEEKKTTNTGGGENYNYVKASNSDEKHVQAFCNSVIESEAKILSNATQGKGQNTLNMCSYNLGKYYKAGLNKEKARLALYNSFIGRKYSSHSKKEFNRIFEHGFKAGINNSKAIKNRPYRISNL